MKRRSLPHSTEENELFTTSNFCGTCHDVRSAKPDVVTGEPFCEWKKPSPNGKKVIGYWGWKQPDE